MRALAHRCRCSNPLSPDSTERCVGCAAAWEVWASVAVLGDHVACPTCDRLADDDLYPADDAGLRCRQCIDDEWWPARAREDE